MSDTDRLLDSAFEALDARHRERDSLPTYQPLMAVAHAGLQLRDQDVEHVLAYWLDCQGRLLGTELLAKGSTVSCDLSRSHIARRALAAGAEGVILAHNHPSGFCKPSQQDIEAAGRIDRQLAGVGVLVVGHYTVAEDGFADIRAGQVTTWAALAKSGSPDTEALRCPHCNGPLEATT